MKKNGGYKKETIVKKVRSGKSEVRSRKINREVGSRLNSNYLQLLKELIQSGFWVDIQFFTQPLAGFF